MFPFQVFVGPEPGVLLEPFLLKTPPRSVSVVNLVLGCLHTAEALLVSMESCSAPGIRVIAPFCFASPCFSVCTLFFSRASIVLQGSARSQLAQGRLCSRYGRLKTRRIR